MKGLKTIVLVTNQLHYLPKADYIVVLAGGKLVEQGTYDKLSRDLGNFSDLMKKFGFVGEEEKEEPKPEKAKKKPKGVQKEKTLIDGMLVTQEGKEAKTVSF